MDLFFKLFNSIKSQHEATEFARLELSALVGKVEPVGNVIELTSRAGYKPFLNANFEVADGGLRFIDALTYELPYGRVQGYAALTDGDIDLDKLARRLAYTREIYVSTPAKAGPIEPQLRKLFASGIPGKNLISVRKGHHLLLRIVTDQFFLEKSEYVSRLSRDENEVRRNTEALLHYLSRENYRVPASATLRVGRRLEDWFAIREEASLYLTHYMYPYKGKFHPKMARALINYVCPESTGSILDNFAGSGTTLVEAVSLGLEGVGMEINPLSSLMCQAKCDCLMQLSPEDVLTSYRKLRSHIEEGLKVYSARKAGKSFLDDEFDITALNSEVEQLKPVLAKFILDGEASIAAVVLARNYLICSLDKPEGRFLMMVVGGTVSDITRRTSAEFLPAMDIRFQDLYLRILLANILREELKLVIGSARAYVGDNRDMTKVRSVDGRPSVVPSGSISGVVNSPPYSTALDYIENDFPQLVLLKLGRTPEELQSEMIGLPKARSKEAQAEVEAIEQGHSDGVLKGFPRENVLRLIHAGRKDAALRSAKFFIDMKASLNEMYRVLAPGRKAAIVIGNNLYKAMDGSPVESENDEAILALGTEVGFEKDYVLTERDLEKSSTGAIRSESIVCLRKPAK